MNGYRDFIESKSQAGGDDGFAPTFMPSAALGFQRLLIDWSVRRGRAALFADCGLGKTVMQLAWAQNVVEHTNGNVLIITPLAVSYQTLREGTKFGIECRRSLDGKVQGRITVTNYQRLHLFDRTDFVGVVCDESGILKSFDGVTRNLITEFMAKMRYRLLCTATAAPNDYTELGTSSEALGHLGHVDMLARFFHNDQRNVQTRRHYGEAPKWRFKWHAETPFWRWVSSWARAIRSPSDLDCDATRFTLPALNEAEHCVGEDKPMPGRLFTNVAVGLQDQRDEQRFTLKERCSAALDLAPPQDQYIVWCNLNAEGDELERIIPGAVQVKGSDRDEDKEGRLLSFADGQTRILITKPKIGAWGLNLQNCSNVCLFPTHSYEQYYQCIRRCWRFGQRRPVSVSLITTPGQKRVLENLRRKESQASRMFTALVEQMNAGMNINRNQHVFNQKEKLPSWL